MKTRRCKNENCRRPSLIRNLQVSRWVITPPTFPKQVGCRIHTWIQTWSFEGFLQCSTHACSSWAQHAVTGRNNNRTWVWRHKIQKYKDWPLQHPMLRNIPLTFEKCHHNLTPTLLLAVETAYRDSCSSFTWDFQIFWRHCAGDQTWPRHLRQVADTLTTRRTMREWDAVCHLFAACMLEPSGRRSGCN